MGAKNASGSAKKKTGVSGKTPRARQSAARRPRAKASRGRNAAYVLIIMVLLTALILVINKYFDIVGPAQKGNPKEPVAAEQKGVTDEPQKTQKEKPEQEKQIRKEQGIETAKEPSEAKPDEEAVRLYFMQFNEKTEKMYLSTVFRRVEKKSLLENTIKELIKGPTFLEKKKGMLSAVPSDLKLNHVKVRNNTAELDFNSAIERGAGGSVLLNRIDQIVYTSTQFPEVKSVIIKINGRKQQSLGSDGLSIEGPLHRRR